MTSRAVMVFVTCPRGRVARRLATIVVTKRLAACVNIVPAVRSIFRWQGKMEQGDEALLLIKTTARRFPALSRAIKAAHPYDVPEMIALPIATGFPPYLAWISQSVTPRRAG